MGSTISGAVLVPPPRLTGQMETDYPALMQWMTDFYKGVVLENAFATSKQLNDSNASVAGVKSDLTALAGNDGPIEPFDPATLPDPASTNVAQAQQTANNAYILANDAKTEADANNSLLLLEKAGTVTLSGANRTATISLPNKHPDTKYCVVFSAESYTGTPPLDSMTVVNVAKQTDQFVITINSAPGSSGSPATDNTVTLAWHVKRTG